MTEIVGILNVTPDSFSDGGQYNAPNAALRRVDELFEEGADMIDIGAESTRPGASQVNSSQEWERLAPIIRYLRDLGYDPLKFSVDTRHADVARHVFDVWSPEVTINDVTGMTSDPDMSETICDAEARIIVGHTPLMARGDMSVVHSIKLDSIERVRIELAERCFYLLSQGMSAGKIILDPGIGFGKSKELNQYILENPCYFSTQHRIMLGYSRKRFLGLGRMKPETNVAAGRVAVQNGLTDGYLRVHDVAAHRRMLGQEGL